jgi:hypothetical protein
MTTSLSKKRICVACNEDGFGPSAFAYYVVRELLDKRPEMQVTVLNSSAESFNRRIYEGRAVQVHKVDSVIKLLKPSGEVHVRQSLNIMKSYQDDRLRYLNEVRPLIEGCDLALDIGVPLFVRAAHELNVRHRVTLFDHSWAATLRLITSMDWEWIYENNPKPTDDDRAEAEQIARLIEEDESWATHVFLFDEYITPKEFLEHWRRICANKLQIIPGVLGRREAAADAYNKLNLVLIEHGQRPVPPDKPLVLVSPGGTPVWDEVLPDLIEQVLSAAKQNYILVLSKDPTKSLSMSNEDKEIFKQRIKNSDRIRYYEYVSGATQQVILPAFDRIVTRAGGGTVNDALAAGIRFVCVEEPQVQIKLIERECMRLGLIPEPTTLRVFRSRPMDCINQLVRAPLPDPHIHVPNQAELGITECLLSLLEEN